MNNVVFMLALWMPCAAFAQAKVFSYEDRGKIDPFLPLVSPAGVMLSYDKDLNLTDMVLEGIVTDAKGKNIAIINSKVGKPKDKVGPYVVQTIGTDEVELVKEQERFTLKLKKGGT